MTTKEPPPSNLPGGGPKPEDVRLAPDPESGGAITKVLAETGLGHLWLIVLAIWGGTVNYISRIKTSKAAFSITELIGEWTISGFAGIMTALVCHSLEWDWYLTAAATGIAGHMGGRAIGLAEHWFSNRIMR